MVNHTPEVLGVLYDHLDKPWKYERRRLAWDQLKHARSSSRSRLRPPPGWCAPASCRPRSSRGSSAGDGCAHGSPSSSPISTCMPCRSTAHRPLLRGARRNTRASREPRDSGRDSPSLGYQSTRPSPPLDNTAMRRSTGLDPARTTSSSRREASAWRVQRLVGNLLQLTHRAQAVVVCGRSEVQATAWTDGGTAPRAPRARRRWPPRPRSRAHGSGGRPRRQAWRPDHLGKPWPEDSAFVIVNPIPGQEERNADHLLEQGAAIRCNNLPVLAWKIDCLLEQSRAPGKDAGTGAAAGAAARGAQHRGHAAGSASQVSGVRCQVSGCRAGHAFSADYVQATETQSRRERKILLCVSESLAGLFFSANVRPTVDHWGRWTVDCGLFPPQVPESVRMAGPSFQLRCA